MSDRLTQMQERFAKAYCSNGGDGTKAAIEAGASPKSAHVTASKWLKTAKIIRCIHALQDEAAEVQITTIKQVRAFWSDVVRDDSQRMQDRLKASELFAKAEGAFLHFRPDPDDPGRYAFGEIGGGDDVIIYLPQIEPAESAEMPEEDAAVLERLRLEDGGETDDAQEWS